MSATVPDGVYGTRGDLLPHQMDFYQQNGNNTDYKRKRTLSVPNWCQHDLVFLVWVSLDDLARSL